MTLTPSTEELAPMAEGPDDLAPGDDADWADRLWGPRSDDLDLGPELLTRQPPAESARCPSGEEHGPDGVAGGPEDLDRRLAGMEDRLLAAVQDAVRDALAEQSVVVLAALDAQRQTFEDALMALARAVGGERRSSAALVRDALASNDQLLRQACDRLEYLSRTVGAQGQSPDRP